MKKPVLWTVEDSEEMQKTLGCVFSRLGCEVVPFLRADTALEKLKAGERPDLMILDFKLPGMSGPQLYRRMAIDSKLRQIPIVPFTSQLEEEEEDASLEAGEWHRMVDSLDPSLAPKAAPVPKEPGDELTVPERLIITVASQLKTLPSGLPKPYQDALIDLLNRVMGPLNELD